MTVILTDDRTVRLEGICTIEDAEALLRRLSDDPDAEVDWSECNQAHAAVIQVLLAARPRMIGAPRDAFLRAHVSGLINAP